MNNESPQRTDQEIVAATLKDRHAFAALVDRYEASLRRYATRLGSSDPEITTDILQESFIKAYININDYDPSMSFSAWLYRIVHNETVSHFRRIKNRPRSVEREEDLAIFDSIADDLDIERETDARLRSVAIQAAVDELEPQYKDVVVLRFFEHKSYEEISDILRIPSGTVATYLNRAKARLRVLLASKSIETV